MAQKKVSAKAFVDATLKTKALLTFVDPQTGEGQTDEFEIVYRAFSPKKWEEFGEWARDFDKKIEALEGRFNAHQAEEAKRRLRHDAEESEREESALAAGEAFTPAPFEAAPPFDDPEVGELKYALAQIVARLVVSIPEIVEGEGEEERPIPITVETLSEFAESNLRSIRDAVFKHSAADPTRPASSPSS
jgi:hypothetical protein